MDANEIALSPAEMASFFMLQRGGCVMLKDPGPLSSEGLITLLMLERCALPHDYPAAYGFFPEHKDFRKEDEE